MKLYIPFLSALLACAACAPAPLDGTWSGTFTPEEAVGTDVLPEAIPVTFTFTRQAVGIAANGLDVVWLTAEVDGVLLKGEAVQCRRALCAHDGTFPTLLDTPAAQALSAEPTRGDVMGGAFEDLDETDTATTDALDGAAMEMVAWPGKRTVLTGEMIWIPGDGEGVELTGALELDRVRGGGGGVRTSAFGGAMPQ